MNISICGIDDVRKFHGQVTHILSIIDPDESKYIQELGVAAKNRLALYCDDVDSFAEAQARKREMPGSRCVAPTEAMVKEALNFAKGLTKIDALLVHCGYGISRSTAIAFAILCQAQPKTPEAQVINQLIKIRPQASPNALIVKHADKLLNRRGRMVKALRS